VRRKGVETQLTIYVNEDIQCSKLVEGGGEAVIQFGSCVGSEGEGEFNVHSGGVLSGGTEVADELVELLEGKVGISKVVDR